MLENIWTKKTTEVAQALNTHLEDGLTEKQVQQSREKYGENKLPKEKEDSAILIFAKSFLEPLVLVLLGVVVICLFIQEYKEAIIIAIIVIINAIIGTVQEIRSQNALAALNKLTTPKTTVKRNGNIVEINSDELVTGDLVLLDAGKFIPADLRIVESAYLQIDESALTGESVPVEKNANILLDEQLPLADRTNMAYMSTYITNGRAVGIVVGVGTHTEIGKIAQLMAGEKPTPTPLQERLADLSKLIAIGAFILAVLMLILNVIKGMPIGESFITSITLAVAIIPESLPVIVSIILAISVTQMAKNRAVVKKMPAVETLGSINIICTDKTGTLTMNQMTVKQFFVSNEMQTQAIDGLKDKVNKTGEEKQLLQAMVLCNDSLIDDQGNNIGDPTELALTMVGNELGMNEKIFRVEHPRIDEIPFDSGRKLMTTVHQMNNHKIAYTKGAIDQLLAKAKYILINNQIEPLSEKQKEQILALSETMSQKALRVLAFGMVSDEYQTFTALEQDLIFIGAVGMIDPERKEAKQAIAKAQHAGVKTVMITGDHRSTAYAIAQNLAMVDNESQVISGTDLDAMSDEEFAEKVDQFVVFSRVSPEHKVRIVNALKAKGNIVSMTGDGVNDAPSLQAAHIGVAMGITGTDVAKSAAAMILMDDNFATIVKAIEEGRNIYNKIKRAIAFIISTNLGEVSAIFIAALIGIGEPLTAVQVLWVNLLVESLIAIPMGMDVNDADVMEAAPRQKDESIFKGMTGKIGVLALSVIIAVLSVYIYGLNVMTKEVGRSMAFFVMATAPMFYALSLRNETKSMFHKLFANRSLWFAIGIGLVMNVLLIWSPVNDFFSLVPLGLTETLLCIGGIIFPTITAEVYKVLRK